ncbi:hypothetical protein BJX63DRAFT_416671 [Aspergillus granulosus]|uniref:LysM domain-containing protein n=1 Tax=Aspergillus granulosus TaxID=176169 RepID=A0ABR4GRV0_9EURO
MDECANAIDALYEEALSRCGTVYMNLTVDGKVVDTYNPMDLVKYFQYRYELPCLQDMKAGDTINGLADAVSIKTDWILMLTGLPMDTETLAEGEELCLDNILLD